MLVGLSILIAASFASGGNTATSVCEVGRLALRDLPTIDQNKGYARFYGDAELKSGDLLTVCPALQREIPPDFPLADEIVRKRVNDHTPTPLNKTPPTMIFGVGIPLVSSNGKTAVVEMGYTCTGTCGAGFIARYVKSSSGWRRDGNIRGVFVS